MEIWQKVESYSEPTAQCAITSQRKVVHLLKVNMHQL